MNRQLPEELISTATNRELALQEQVDFLQEQVESQKRYLDHMEQQLLEIKQELNASNLEMDYMNQELQYMSNEWFTSSSQSLTLDEAKELANTILAKQKPTRDALAEVLSAIYSVTVKPWDLEPGQIPSEIRLNPTTKAHLVQLRTQHKQLQAHMNKLRDRYVALKTQFDKQLG